MKKSLALLSKNTCSTNWMHHLILIVSSTQSVSLKIDPSVVLATRKYVDDNIIEVRAYADKLMADHLVNADAHPQYAKKADIADGLVPVGAVFPWPTSIPPDGWLKCNGAAFDKAQYPKLAQVYPSGYLPDLRGEFIRGYDDGRGVNVGAQLLTPQGATGITDFHGDGVHAGGAGAPPRNFFMNEDSSFSASAGFTAFGDKTIFKDGVAKYVTFRPRCVPFNFITRKA